MYEKIRRWFYLGLWTEAMIRTAAEKSLLTPEEAEEILERKES